jgi:HPt (histidine-containing phosphotransfer) domain-containing protein
MSRTFDERELLERVDNDWEFLGDTVRMLAEDAPGLLAGVRRAVEAGDGPGVGRAAHTLKGMISNFCAPDAQASALAVEQVGKGGNLVGAVAALHELEAHLNALVADLTDFVATRA